MIELTGYTNEEKIYNFLIAVGYTPAGVCGIMANLYAESGLRSNNLQNGYESEFGSDSYYTSSINDKTYSKEKFINDEAGYGIAQWTYYSRKKGLYETTVEQGLSIADLGGQLTFLCKELKACSSLDVLLRTTTDYKVASDAVLKDFERPSVLNYDERHSYAKNFYDKYASVNNMNSTTPSNSISNNASSNYRTHTVKSVEGWWSIAADELGSGTKMEELAEFNGMNTSTILHPGNIVKIPDNNAQESTVTVNKNEEVTTSTVRYINYTVKNNDSWWSIAENKLGSGVKMYELAEFNGKNTDYVLHPGDVLKIPRSNNASSNYRTHTVKSGEGWWSIAATELGDGSRMNELARFNGMTIKTMLHPGNILKIPK